MKGNGRYPQNKLYRAIGWALTFAQACVPVVEFSSVLKPIMLSLRLERCGFRFRAICLNMCNFLFIPDILHEISHLKKRFKNRMHSSQ